jgi:hypothetical protein
LFILTVEKKNLIVSISQLLLIFLCPRYLWGMGHSDLPVSAHRFVSPKNDKTIESGDIGV